jgi:hypothetical protein
MLTKVEQSSIYRMRESGATLQRIAEVFGISRERVRQILVKRYGSSGSQELLNITQVAYLAGCTRLDVFKLKRRGVIKPAQLVGKGRTYWTSDTVDIVKECMANRQCRVCSRQLPDNHWVFCSYACWAEASKIKNRPMQQRNIQKQRMSRYFAKRAKERYQNNHYIVRLKCPVPLGTKVNVLGVGNTKGKLRVEWKDEIVEIPANCVKRVSGQI